MRKKISLILLGFLFSVCCVYAHASFNEHSKDIMDVFGFQSNVALNEWARFISSDMIDKIDFYKAFKNKHSGFRCKHRLFFHWGYNAKPWNQQLERKTEEYCRNQQFMYPNKKVSIADTLLLFKKEIEQEQKRRNSSINNRTEILFGFAHGGKDASFARFFAAMAYDIHLVGDYTSDNTDLEGVQNISEVISLIIIELRNLDNRLSTPIIKEMTKINKRFVGPQKKADILLLYLKQSIPNFVKEAQNGSIYRRLKKNGIRFV